MRVRIGLGSCGIAAGASKIFNIIKDEVAARGLDIDLQQTGCIGMCHHEPLLDVIEDDGTVYTYGHVTPDNATRILDEHICAGKPVEDVLVGTSQKPNDFLAGQLRIALGNCGVIDPERYEDYVDAGGYEALRKAVGSMTPEQVIEEIKVSGLRGRGGAGFPTWFKWQATRQTEGDRKYIICNADEGDPGAFMERSLLEGDPHNVIEGMIIAANSMWPSLSRLTLDLVTSTPQRSQITPL